MTDKLPKARDLRRHVQVEKRLALIDQSRTPDAARRARLKLVFDVLEAIAKGSAVDPAKMAAALLNGLSRVELMPQSPLQAQTFEECKAALTKEADNIASSLVLSERVLDYLYDKSRSGLPRREWQTLLRSAYSTGEATRRLYHTLNWERLMDREAADEAFAKLSAAKSASKGMLLLTYHGAYVIAAMEVLKKRFDRVALVRRSHLEIGDKKEFTNSRDVTFGALRLLQQGGMVLLAPDGPIGRQSVKLEIFDGDTLVADGAGFLAHTSKSNTAWYTVVRHGDRFAPVVEPGPTPEPGESLKVFSDRLNRFYAKKIEKTFSDDPRNISLWTWGKRFLAIMDASETQEPALSEK